MVYPTMNLTDAEKNEFIKSNAHGILSFAGEDPYAIPLGYMYRKGDLLVGFASGRKMDYLKKSHKVCFTICRPRWFSPKFKESCTTIIMEGQLEELADPSYYDVKIPEESVDGHLYVIKPTNLGTRKCLADPCEILSGAIKVAGAGK